MQFTRRFSDGVRAGTITRSYRVWKRPQARVGGRYSLMGGGVIEVTAIERERLRDVTDDAARASGFEDRDALETFLGRGADAVYRVEFDYLGPGRKPGPDQQRRGEAALADLETRLARMDARAGAAWTAAALTLIDANEGTRAADLAPSLSLDTAQFKQRIRRLKALGLTVSLETGYRLSPLGRQLHARLARK